MNNKEGYEAQLFAETHLREGSNEELNRAWQVNIIGLHIKKLTEMKPGERKFLSAPNFGAVIFECEKADWTDDPDWYQFYFTFENRPKRWAGNVYGAIQAYTTLWAADGVLNPTPESEEEECPYPTRRDTNELQNND